MRPSCLALLALLTACGGDTGAPPLRVVVLAATHTLEDSGLLDSLATAFDTSHTALRLRVTVSGTGEALEHARRGLADVVLTHAPEQERQALEAGVVLDRRELMYNTFVLAGPRDDPAGVRGMADAVAAFARLASNGASFVSRDDRSGTNLRELQLWRAAAVAPPSGGRYIRAGVGMADALRIADERRAYILTDTATLVILAGDLSLEPLVYGDPRLRNTYAVMRVTASRDSAAARVLADWLAGADAAAIIARFGGRPGLFVPLNSEP